MQRTLCCLLLVVTFMLIFVEGGVAGGAGEFLVTGATGGVTVTIELQGWGYGYDKNLGIVTYIPPFSSTLNQDLYPDWRGWDCPRSQKNQHMYMPWGNVKVTVHVPNELLDFEFYVDTQDYKWATDNTAYPEHDTYLVINRVPLTFRLCQPRDTIWLTQGAQVVMYDFWGNSSADLSNFGTPVDLKNEYNGADLGGFLTYIYNTNIPSGTTPAIHTSWTSIRIGTSQERFPTSGETLKHRMWNEVISDGRLVREIPVPNDRFRQTAIFDAMAPAVIRAEIDGAEGGQVEFLDPWYVTDQAGHQPNTNDNPEGQVWNVFSPSGTPPGAYDATSGGVFLRQSVATDRPYYAVRALMTRTISGRNAHFAYWTVEGPAALAEDPGYNAPGYSQQAVTFTSGGAQITANYKGHLCSDASSLLSSNSQRKVAVCGTESYAVYASGGLIWFTKNTGVGGWSGEVLISSATNRHAKNPSITAFINPPLSTTPKVIVAWEDQTSEEDPIHRVHYRVSTDDGDTWQAITDLDAAAVDVAATPVVDGCSLDANGVGILVSVADAIPNRYLNIQVVPGDPGWCQPVPETEGTTSQSPSLARSAQGNWHLVYERSGQIFYQEFTVANNAPSFIGSPILISGSYSGCAKPSVAVSASGTVVTVAWEASGTGGMRIVTCQKTSGGAWSTPVEISHGTHAGHNPSIGIDDNAQTETIAFECDTHIGVATKALTGGSWSTVQDLGQGNVPGVSDNNLAAPIIEFTQGSSVPYEVRLGSYQQYVQTLAEENKSLYSAASHNNSGRHLAVGEGKFHELFMSGGEVFYRRQDRSSGTWETTRRISTSGGSVTLDALCRMSDGSLHAVWEELISGTTFRIKYSRSSDGDAWSAPVDLETSTTASTNQWSTYPTIGYIGTKLVVVHCYTGGLRYKVSSDGGLTWPSTWNPITTSYPSYVWYPSLTTFYSTLWLSYDYRLYGVFLRTFNGTTWSSETNVSTATGTIYGRCSSITSFASPSMIAFCAQKSGQSEYRSVARWSTELGITQFLEFPRIIGVNDFYPSVTKFWEPALSNNLHMLASYTSDNRVRLWTFGAGPSPTIYDERFLTTDGAYAQLTPEWETTSPCAATVQWTAQQGNPHTVGLWSGRTLSKTSAAPSDVYAHSRRLVIGDTLGGTTVSYELSPVKMLLASGDTTIIPFDDQQPLSAPEKNVDSLLGYLGTEEFEVPANARSLVWRLSAQVNNPTDTVGGCEPTGFLAERSGTIELKDERGSRLASSMIVGTEIENGALLDLSRIRGKKVRLALQDIASLRRGMTILGMGDVYSVRSDDTTSTLKKVGLEMPTQFALSEAYPNPFNPTTTLRFALPVAGRVSLIIYDVVGREVSSLATGMFEAGYHSVQWNASSMASGMYFARLTIKDDLGGVSFTRVSKLLLVK